jgi:hypothetical protein
MPAKEINQEGRSPEESPSKKRKSITQGTKLNNQPIKEITLGLK